MSTTPLQDKEAQQEESTLEIRDLVYLCLAKWQWFVISLVVCLGLAVMYLLTTAPTYQRTATLMIKDDSKSKSIGSDVASMFSDMGLAAGQNNVYNELNAIQSPAILLETGKRLNYDIEYKEQGTFHKNVLYGPTLPVQVIFHDLQPEQSAALTLRLNNDGTYTASDFKLSGEAGKDLPDTLVTGKLNEHAATPVGKLTVAPAAGFDAFVESGDPIFISRSDLYAMTTRLQSNLEVTLVDKNATLIDISYKDVLPSRTEDVINTMIAVYKESWINDKNLITTATSDFITNRLGVIERELGDVDQDISTYKSSHLLPDVEAASQIYMEQAKETNSQILELSTRRAIANYMKGCLSDSNKKNQLLPANTGIDAASVEKQIDEYNTNLLQRNSLVANSSETNPLVLDLDQSLAAMREAILSSIDNLIVSIDTQISHLQQEENRTISQIATSPDQAKYLQSVGRQQKVKEALYLFLLQKREENELSQAFMAYNTRLVTPPTGTLAPIAPSGNKILLIAFMLGLAIPVGLIFAIESMDTKVRGRKDLEGLDIPFLGEIPFCGHKPHWWERKRHSATPRTIMVQAGKRDVINEAFRVLRTNIEFVSNANAGTANVIMITSFNPGSGKSFLTVNIAKSFAIRGKKVLVVDGDLRRGSSSDYVGQPDKGLTDYLSGRADSVEPLIVTRENAPGLSVLPIGPMPPNPTELLYSDRLGAMFKKLRTQYDYIFIDCPPVEIVADARILEQYADRAIFVVRAGLLERSMLKELQKLYNEKTHKNLAIILNGTESSGGRYGHKYGYRYGYGYGYGYGYHYGGKHGKHHHKSSDSSENGGGQNKWREVK